MRILDGSIRNKLSLVSLLTCAFALLIACLGFAIYEHARFNESRATELSALADSLATNTAASIAFNDQETARKLLSSVKGETHIVGVFLYDEHERLFEKYCRKDVPCGTPGWRPDGYTITDDQLSLFRAVWLNGYKTGTIAIVSDLTGFHQTLWTYAKIAVLVLLFSLLATFFISRRLLRIVTDPILALSNVASRISSQEDFSLRVNLERTDEVGQLVRAFNHMVDCVHQRDAALKDANDTLEVRVQQRTAELEQEIAERKRAEQALSASKQRYQMLYNHNFAAVFHSSGGRLKDCNEATCKLLGYTREELHALDLRDLYCNPADRTKGQRELQVRGQLRNYEVTLRRKDGSQLHVLANLNLMREENSPEPIIAGVLLDITEVRKLQEQLVQSQKLDAIGKLTGGIAHDFNNILMIISSYGEIALDHLDANSPVRRHLTQICAAGQRAAALTRQLLAFSRKQMMNPEVIDLSEVVSKVLEMLRRLLNEDISLESTSVAGLWKTKADRSQIEQVLFNLVVNARDAMPNGGKLLVRTENVRLGEDFVRMHAGSVSGEYVHLSVADSGIGILPEHQLRIFEPFFTTKAPGKGTGLGLSTVYGIVKQSGGYITVESKVGIGTTFQIYLPRSVQQSSVIPDHAPKLEIPAGATVLLAEDEGPTREAIADYLEQHGFRVVSAGSGEEALQRSVAMEVDLLLTDVVMPGMNGVELAAKFQVEHPGTRVIFMSGYTDDVLVHKGMSQSHASLLKKPFRLPDLLITLRGALTPQN